MAPGGGGKRKRGERSYSGESRDDGSRPSPHRPDSLSLGQRTHQQFQQPQPYGRGNYNDRGRGSRRGNRGGPSAGSQRSPLQSPDAIPHPPGPINAISKPTSPKVPQLSASLDPKPHGEPDSSQPVAKPEDQQVESAKRLLAYEYEHVTDGIINAWAEHGRQKLMVTGTQAREVEDSLTLGNLFQELLQAGVDARISPADAGSVVKDIIDEKDDQQEPPEVMSEDLAFDASSLFLDTLSIFAEPFDPLPPSLTTLVYGTGISATKMRRELDSSLLVHIGLIRSTFVRVGIRQQTNLLYRQSNYNLLREETEGYSKLVTEFFTTSNNEPPTSEVVEETFERVKGMIGSFDLDVGRVLDITLDVFAAVLVKQYRFFVKYLRASSWWPQDIHMKDADAQYSLGPLPRWALPGFEGRVMTIEEREKSTEVKTERDSVFWERCRHIGLPAFFEIGGRRAEEQMLEAATVELRGSDSSEANEDRKWIEVTRTLPPTGNKTAAQVLGFKLRFYSSRVRDSTDILPVNLIFLAALLIKIGFITLRDLYPHIWPEDVAMENVRDEKMKEKLEKEKLNRPGGGTNALLAAAPLPDDTIEGQAREATRLREADAIRRHQKTELPTGRSTPVPQPEEKRDELPEPADQKVQLLKSLLCIGALPEALYMLGRFPWLPDAFPDLPEYIHRILHHCLSKLYEPRRPLRDEAGLQEQQQIPDADQVGVSKGKVKLSDMPARRTMRWAQLDKDDTSEAVDYRFYWDDWADVIPVCQDVDDLFTLCSTLLNFSGVKIGQDTTLLLKLSRIGSHSLSSDPSKANMTRWIDLSKRLLVPALSLTKCNPGVVNEVFELIKHFPDSTRYNIYAEWYNGQISRLPDIKSAFEQTKAETRDVLKRISKTTIKPMARALAKVTYASPGIVFSVAIGQLEAYENIVDTFVECARYFTYLAYDVLTWSLMSSLGAQGRNRLQADGMLTSRWLAALSLFAGKVFKRYSVMNPLPIVQYVEDQLRQGNSTDLIVLENITRSMAGIISDVSFNESQVVAMGGGELMQSQTLQQLLDRRHDSKSTAKRLIKPLTDSRMAGQVLVSLAQERQTCIFRIEEQNAHPKLLGNLFDQIHRVLGQYLDLLRSNLSIKDFDYFVPDVTRLIGAFGIDPSVTFWICRPSINAAIAEYDGKYSKRPSESKKVALKDIVEKQDDESLAGLDSPTDGNVSAVATDGKTEITPSKPSEQDLSMDTDAETQATSNDTKVTSISNSPTTEMIEPPQGCHPVLQTIANSIKSTLSAEIWDSLNPSFYATFWQLSLGDVFTTLQPYDDETKRLTNKIKAITADRSDISIAGTQKKNREKAAIQDLVDSLHAEMKERVALKQAVRLKKEKDYWFAGSWAKYDALNLALIEYCFFPRLVMSPVDSLYAFRMIKWLHREGATNFRTMGIYDQFFREKRLTSMIFLCSAKEAECLGRFINDVLRDLSLWHADKAVYEKEAYGAKKNLPGFSRLMKSEKEVDVFLEYEDFRRILLKWHRNLNGALKTCYASGEYMHIRNAINILNNVHHYFPAINWMGSNQLASITELSKNESREDLKIAATSLIGALKKREKNWVLPQAFNLIEGSQAGANGTRSTSARPSTPQPNNAASKPLNPKASEFKPISQPTVNGNVPTAKSTSAKVDAEDGEIDDVQSTDLATKSDGKPAPTSKPDQSAPPLAETKPTLQPSTPGTTPAQAVNSNQASNVNPSPAPNATNQKPPMPTQSTKAPSIPNRPDINRNLLPILPNGHHDLPNRPEGPQFRRSDARMPLRPEERPTQTHPRDLRFPVRGGLDGQRDLIGRGPERNASGPPLRSSVQVDERLGRSGHDDGYSRAMPRDMRSMPSDDRGGRLPPSRPLPESDHGRRDLNSGQHGREPGMPPPRSTIPQHPDRAALIHGHPESNRDQHPRYPERSSQAGLERHSRGPSPTRSEERNSMYERNRPLPDSRHSYDDRQSQGRYEDSHAPTGPRNDRLPMGPPNSSTDRTRDGVKPPPSAMPPIDPNHGRLRQEPSVSRQSESYGRLNAGSDVPSGPRLANGNSQGPPRASRTPSASQPPAQSQQPTPGTQRPASPPAPSRAAPSGPALRNSPRIQPPTAQSNSAPSTPISQGPEIASIHPDRLKAIQGTGPINVNTGLPNQDAIRQPPSPAAPPTGPPRGPQSQMPNAAIQPPVGRGPPTGPADKNRSDKRFTSFQSVLQHDLNGPDKSNQGTSIRGRGARPSNVPSPSTSGPPTPSALRPDPFPARDDLFAGRPNGQGGPPMNEEDARYGRGGRRGPPEPERRSGRHRSRSPGKERPADVRMREGDRPPPREDPRDRFRNDVPPMNIRGNLGPDLRGPPPEMERDMRGGLARRGGRDDMAPREPDRRNGQDWNGDRRGGPGRRGDERDGGGSLRKRGRPGDDGFGDRAMDSKRPRR